MKCLGGCERAKAPPPPDRAHWEEDRSVQRCRGCGVSFGLLCRRHHCRGCGRIFCAMCSSCAIEPPMPELPDAAAPPGLHRACYACYIHHASGARRHCDTESPRAGASGLEHLRASSAASVVFGALLGGGALSVASGSADAACAAAGLAGIDAAAGKGGALPRPRPAPGAPRPEPDSCDAAPAPAAASRAPEPVWPAVSTAPGDVAELAGPRWEAFAALRPELAAASQACAEALASPVAWHNSAEGTLCRLRRSVRHVPREDLVEAPCRDQVVLFCQRFESMRPAARNQISEVRRCYAG